MHADRNEHKPDSQWAADRKNGRTWSWHVRDHAVGPTLRVGGYGVSRADGTLAAARPEIRDQQDAESARIHGRDDCGTGSSLVGRSIEQAGLASPAGHVPDGDTPGDEVLVAVGSERRLAANDRLVFVGIVETVKDLQRIRGLKPAADHVFDVETPRHQRCLVEVVVSDTFPRLGRTIRDGRFRTMYSATVVAVARKGERIRAKIGDIILRPGDTLLIETLPSFADRHATRATFLW